MMEKIRELIDELKAMIASAVKAHVAANAAAYEVANNTDADKAEELKAKAKELKEQAEAATAAQVEFCDRVKKAINVACNVPTALEDEDFAALRELARLGKIKPVAIDRAYRHSNPQRWEEYKRSRKARRARRRRNRRLRRKQLNG